MPLLVSDFKTRLSLVTAEWIGAWLLRLPRAMRRLVTEGLSYTTVCMVTGFLWLHYVCLWVTSQGFLLLAGIRDDWFAPVSVVTDFQLFRQSFVCVSSQPGIFFISTELSVFAFHGRQIKIRVTDGISTRCQHSDRRNYRWIFCHCDIVDINSWCVSDGTLMLRFALW